MAKLTTLQLFNAIMVNCGEAEVENLNNLSGIQTVAWNKLIEALNDICTDQYTKWDFLEASGTIPLVTDTYQYQISALTSGSDMQEEDRESLLAKDYSQKITYLTPQEFDSVYTSGVTGQGLPDRYTKYAGYFVFNAKPTSTYNGKNVSFRYWKLPTLPAVGSPSVQLDIPEPYDRTVLVNLATMKTLAYLGNDEAAIYKMAVFGDGGDVEGSLAKLKQTHSSPELKPRVTYIF